ncbi:MarR family transcriptional regulator [Bradyrhizobium sp. U87765 SZCCT0131]|uniref:MarR family winged helix-turn-helix transcriptional regulator n=1 Tax=unclassified Bradyrhizobium TaxID=2631580 RepID=UPI001BAB0B9A|nr:MULTISPECIES: MarR family transcriptional regulator [unclassified Bradyrhizobium]MBR1218764.1 MarR family transcriptional regulator [Bradyrhizobium sp. U87765 SZCCT0131]MBR1265477.1 MarR family transcriptional regulator [Bradyrhizobium sp. U87765 SZCCT0134]MBR1304263.1 MarR family transcriptional regulator [Bradyrhizobium sp. U87765 SZCCT0110]MBR1319868.1 MarR family transcriptional regulator [Bradyrhizobium sp. U87765 SZCCT0109]MBR1348194.1 MarR family transcriptional regulator [Bradyrhizo
MDRAARAIDEWKTQRPDLDGLPMMVFGRLAEAAHAVAHDHLRPFLQASGLPAGEFDVLATLRRAEPPHALTPTALYDATMVTSGAMTGRIDRLEKAGLVQRKDDPADRRGTIVALTRKGFTLIDDIITRHVENERRLLAGLSRKEQETLANLLGKLIATLPASPSRD